MMRMVPDLYSWEVSIYDPFAREKLRMTPSDAQMAQVLAYGRHVIAASVRLREGNSPANFIHHRGLLHFFTRVFNDTDRDKTPNDALKKMILTVHKYRTLLFPRPL